MRLGLLLSLCLASACGAGIAQQLPGDDLTPQEQETYARRHLRDARALQQEGRLEAALHHADFGLELSPDDPTLLRIRAELLEALGRSHEAAAADQRADALAPPEAAPPPMPLVPSAKGVGVLLLPPPDSPEARGRVPERWPEGPAGQLLAERLALRLPGAQILWLARGEPEDVPAGAERLRRAGIRSAISLRVDRLLCRRTLKDGRFGLAWLRAAVAGPGSEVSLVKHVVEPPPPGEVACRARALALALEDVLAQPAVVAAIERAHGTDETRFTSAQLRALQPDLGRRIDALLEEGHRAVRLGDLGRALASYRAAATIDPEDREARASVLYAERDLSLARQLADRSRRAGVGPPDRPPEQLAPDLLASERQALERELREQQALREDLVAAVAVLEEDRIGPSPSTLAALRPAEIRQGDDPLGLQLAQQEAGGAPLSLRVLYAPDGTVLARYYLAAGEAQPVLRAEDGDGDGRPDRWVAYAGGVRRRVWEDRRGDGQADLILAFAEGGESLERLLLDTAGDGVFDRVLRYRDGRLASEERDVDGDGAPEVFESFAADGSLALREEDLDGDGRPDVRSEYREGRLLRREVLNPAILQQLP